MRFGGVWLGDKRSLPTGRAALLISRLHGGPAMPVKPPVARTASVPAERDGGLLRGRPPAPDSSLFQRVAGGD
ncbi:hypothetical protein [Azospirillum sp. SYSU D00513]|uniref:hypothetical protein n=1 Tax=Azospirillum sp. SYSU D00513 TaxID=2812561 RepID=UPI001A959781|nr:hypothetical protein [Azospirillum sp. SYSU D00513]